MYSGERSFGAQNQHKIYYNHEDIFGNENDQEQQKTNTFRLSQNHYQEPRFGGGCQSSYSIHNNSKINLAQLQCLHKISVIRIQIQMTAFIDLLNLKFSNLKKNAFKCIENTQNSIDLSYCHSKFSKQIVKIFIKKINFFVKIKTLKQKTFIFQSLKKHLIQSHLSAFQTKPINNKEFEKQIRISQKSKIQPSFRSSQIDDLNDTRQKLDKKVLNKELKKKKIKQDQNVSHFFGQMDQLLSVHQDFLSKIK